MTENNPDQCGRTKPHLFHETEDGDCPGIPADVRDRPLPLLERFTYHPPSPEQVPIYELIRDTGYLLALTVEAVAKPSGETTRAYAAIDNVVMLANAAVARHGLADPGYAGAAEVHQLALSTVAKTRQGSPLLVEPEGGLWNGSAATGRVLDDVQAIRDVQPEFVEVTAHTQRAHAIITSLPTPSRDDLLNATASLVAAIELLDQEAARG